VNVLGIDYGEKRIGLSFGDSLGLAVPIAAAVEPSVEKRFEHIGSVIRDRRIKKLVVGMPYNMDGSSGFKAKEVEAFMAQLEKQFSLPVESIDERLTSHQVEEELKKQGRKLDRRSGEIDSRAATLILQDYLDRDLGLNLDIPDPEEL